MKIFTPLPDKKAPTQTVGIIPWLKHNLFSSVWNTVATIMIAAVLAFIIPSLFDWLFFSANWIGTTQDDCTKEGACWVFIRAWSQQFFYGSYLDGQLWRVNLCLIGLIAVISAQYLLPTKYRNTLGIPLFLLLPFICIIILDGRLVGLEYVRSDLWGGFALNILVAAASIIVAFPLSYLWALGRQSDMPLMRNVCILFIEFFRGAPILALFFMGSVMLPLFFPEGVTVDKLVRVWIILILFMAGYMAEVFRSGFQAIPQGQHEAADALGLGYWQKNILIILPQTIKIALPNILATSVMVFKNTTFLLIIGISEVLNTAQSALTNSYWLGGHAPEAYLFVGLVFWVCCFSMSMISSSIERKLETGHKR